MNRLLRTTTAISGLLLLLAPSLLRAEITPKAYRYLWLRQNLHAICASV